MYRIKSQLAGEQKFKAKLVVLGYRQSYDPLIDTFAPVVNITTLRIFLAIGASTNMKIAQFDVSNAFLNGKVKSEVYIYPPDEIDTSSSTPLKLIKSLYGLRESPKAWNECCDTLVSKIGFTATRIDPCLYTRKTSHGCMFIII